MPDREQIEFFARKTPTQRARLAWEEAEVFYYLHRPILQPAAWSFHTLEEYFRWRKSGKGARRVF